MTLEDYKEHAKDLSIVKGEYELETIRTTPLHGKWSSFYITEHKFLNKLNAMMKVLIQERSKFYTGKTAVPFEYVVIKTELPRYLDADPEIQLLQEQIDDQTAVTKYIAGRLECINRRSFEISNSIRWQLFQAGLKSL